MRPKRVRTEHEFWTYLGPRCWFLWPPLGFTLSQTPAHWSPSSLFPFPVLLPWRSDSFNTSLSPSVACLARRRTPSALTVDASRTRTMSQNQNRHQRRLMCPAVAPLPPLPSSSLCATFIFPEVCLCQQNFRPESEFCSRVSDDSASCLRVCQRWERISNEQLSSLSSVHRCGNLEVLVHELWPLTGRSFGPLWSWRRQWVKWEKPHYVPTVNVLFMDLCTFGCDDFST